MSVYMVIANHIHHGPYDIEARHPYRISFYLCLVLKA